MRKFLIPLITGISFLQGTAFLQGTEIRVATFNVLTGIEAPGTLGHDSVRAILGRINADVVGLQEVTGADLSGSPSHLETLASSLGYPHIFIPSGIALDTNSRVALLSKFPFRETHSIASPMGARDVVRAHAAALVDVPGTSADPMIITLHLKCCFETDDFFRRAVELQRLNFFLEGQGLTGEDKLIVMGDFNLLGSDSSFNALPPGLPATFSLGSDIPFPVAYFRDPADYFTAYPLLNPEPRQQNGIATATHSGGSTLDYMMISQALLDGGPVLEIYNSARESSNPGLPKSGSALPFRSSANASDHLPIFGDFDLEAGTVALNLDLSAAQITEGETPATLTVTLPNPPAAGESVTVLLSSSDCLEAMPNEITLTFAPGELSQSTSLLPLRDSIIDGPQSVILTASASGFLSAERSVTVLDRDRSSYVLTENAAPFLEAFDRFQGNQVPASWASSTSDFQGLDDGSSSRRGLRSYGQGSDGSLGILSREEVSLASEFENQTGETIRSLHIAYTAEQWHSFQDGGQNRLEFSLLTELGRIALPELGFTADRSLPSGAISGGQSTRLEANIGGLSIPAGQSFTLELKIIPDATDGSGSDAAFINEFHYDNSGSDQDEFVELVLGPEFAGTIDELSLLFYNGNGGSEYMRRTFSEEDLDQTLATGHRIYSAFIPGIQNGAPDGIALVQNTELLQFLSYEGTFTANDGPAAGLSSLNIGVSQGPAPAPGTGSLGLSGSGSGPDEFDWVRTSGAFTKGEANENQDFAVTARGQGIALDELSLTPFASPLSSVEDFSITISPDFMLSFPTENGISYQVESSLDLLNWSDFQTILGDGNEAFLEVPSDERRLFFRVRF